MEPEAARPPQGGAGSLSEKGMKGPARDQGESRPSTHRIREGPRALGWAHLGSEEGPGGKEAGAQLRPGVRAHPQGPAATPGPQQLTPCAFPFPLEDWGHLLPPQPHCNTFLFFLKFSEHVS